SIDLALIVRGHRVEWRPSPVSSARRRQLDRIPLARTRGESRTMKCRAIRVDFRRLIVVLAGLLASHCLWGSEFDRLQAGGDASTGLSPDGGPGPGPSTGSSGSAGTTTSGSGGSAGAGGAGAGAGAGGTSGPGGAAGAGSGTGGRRDGGSVPDGGSADAQDVTSGRGDAATPDATVPEPDAPRTDGPPRLPDAPIDSVDASVLDAASGNDGGSDGPIDVWKCEGTDASPGDVPCTINDVFGIFVAPTGN